MGEDDSSAHARRVTDPGQGEAGGISLRWQLMDCDKDGETLVLQHVFDALCVSACNLDQMVKM